MNDKGNILADRFTLGGLIALSGFAVLAFGAVHVWAYTVLQILTFLLLSFFLLTRIFQKERRSLTWIRTPIALFLFLFLGLILFQLLPLPAALLEWLSPKTAMDRFRTHKILDPEATALNRAFLAYAVHPVLREGLKLIACIGIFFLALHLLNSRKRIDITIYTLILMGLFQSLYSIHTVFSDSARIWWWQSRSAEHGFASGTFIVSNHFAFYLEMLIPLAFGFAIAQQGRKGRFAPGLSAPKDLVQRFVSWFAPESANPKMLFLFFSAILMGSALLLSASRGGILSLSAAMLIMGGLFLSRRGYRRYSGIALLFCLFTVLYGLYVGIGPTVEKFERTEGLVGRLNTAKTLIPIIEDYPALGVGWGNLFHLYFRYVPENRPLYYTGVWTAGHPHNDWLEAGTEAGMIGLFLLMGGLALFLLRLIRIWYRRRDLHAIGIGAGVITGMISIGFHSFFDFSLRTPANPVMVALVGAIGFTALHRTGRGYSETFFYEVRNIRLSVTGRVFAGLLTVLFAAGGIHLSWRHLMAEANCPTEWNSTLNLDWNPHLAKIERAIEYNPLNADYHFKRAVLFMQKAERAGGMERVYRENAVRSLKTSLHLNPGAGLRWHALAGQYARLDGDPVAYVNRWLPLADRCQEMALGWSPTDDDLLARVAEYWIWRAGTLPDSDTSSTQASDLPRNREEGILQFQNLIRRLLTRDPERWQRAVRKVWNLFPDEAVLIGMIPEEKPDLQHQVLQWAVTHPETGKSYRNIKLSPIDS